MTRKGKQPGGGGKRKGPRLVGDDPKPELVVDEAGNILARQPALSDSQKARKLERALRLQEDIDHARMVEAEAKRQYKEAKAATSAAVTKLQDHLHGVPEQGELFAPEREDLEAASRPLDDQDLGEDPADGDEEREGDAGDHGAPEREE